MQRVGKRLERLETEKQELQGQVKRAYQKLNILTIRNDYLEHKLRKCLEENEPAIFVADEDDG